MVYMVGWYTLAGPGAKDLEQGLSSLPPLGVSPLPELEALGVQN